MSYLQVETWAGVNVSLELRRFHPTPRPERVQEGSRVDRAMTVRDVRSAMAWFDDGSESGGLRWWTTASAVLPGWWEVADGPDPEADVTVTRERDLYRVWRLWETRPVTVAFDGRAVAVRLTLGQGDDPSLVVEETRDGETRHAVRPFADGEHLRTWLLDAMRLSDVGEMTDGMLASRGMEAVSPWEDMERGAWTVPERTMHELEIGCWDHGDVEEWVEVMPSSTAEEATARARAVLAEERDAVRVLVLESLDGEETSRWTVRRDVLPLTVTTRLADGGRGAMYVTATHALVWAGARRADTVRGSLSVPGRDAVPFEARVRATGRSTLGFPVTVPAHALGLAPGDMIEIRIEGIEGL